MTIKQELPQEILNLIETNQVFEVHINELEELINLRNDGQLTKSEADELIGDILDLERINELAEGIEFDAKLAKILSAVVAIIPKMIL